MTWERRRAVPPGGIRAEVGKRLLQWTEGSLDIHFINSGRENAHSTSAGRNDTAGRRRRDRSPDGTEVPQNPDANAPPLSRLCKTNLPFPACGLYVDRLRAPSHFHIDHSRQFSSRNRNVACRLSAVGAHGAVR